jgi:hypothetical protein
MAVGRLQSYGAPDSPVRHRTLSGAPATSRSRWNLTVGAEVFWTTGQSGGAPDRSCKLSGAPDFYTLWRALNVVAGDHWRGRSRCSGDSPDSPVNYSGADSRSHRVQSRFSLWHRTLSGGTPDSPVNYSGAPLRIPEGGELSLESPGAPDSPVRQTRVPFGLSFALLFEPFSWSFYWLIVNLWHL